MYVCINVCMYMHEELNEFLYYYRMLNFNSILILSFALMSDVFFLIFI